MRVMLSITGAASGASICCSPPILMSCSLEGCESADAFPGVSMLYRSALVVIDARVLVGDGGGEFGFCLRAVCRWLDAGVYGGARFFSPGELSKSRECGWRRKRVQTNHEVNVPVRRTGVVRNGKPNGCFYTISEMLVC